MSEEDWEDIGRDESCKTIVYHRQDSSSENTVLCDGVFNVGLILIRVELAGTFGFNWAITPANSAII